MRCLTTAFKSQCPLLDGMPIRYVFRCFEDRNRIYISQDRPLHTWVPYTDEYVEENLRREGRGSRVVYEKCAGVRCNDPQRVCPNRACPRVAEYRCVDQACAGESMHCSECIVVAHARLPTHFIEVSGFFSASGHYMTYIFTEMGRTPVRTKTSFFKRSRTARSAGPPARSGMSVPPQC